MRSIPRPPIVTVPTTEESKEKLAALKDKVRLAGRSARGPPAN